MDKLPDLGSRALGIIQPLGCVANTVFIQHACAPPESPIIVFFKLPIPSISVTTSSPSFTSARPSGVPVKMISPGDRVIKSLR